MDDEKEQESATDEPLTESVQRAIAKSILKRHHMKTGEHKKETQEPKEPKQTNSSK